MIVDNSLIIIERLVNILKEASVVEKISAATNYKEAVDGLHRGKTDIVLMDIQLPVKKKWSY